MLASTHLDEVVGPLLVPVLATACPLLVGRLQREFDYVIASMCVCGGEMRREYRDVRVNEHMGSERKASLRPSRTVNTNSYILLTFPFGPFLNTEPQYFCSGRCEEDNIGSG